MGANSSKAVSNEKLIIERLRSLEMRDDEYFNVNEKSVPGISNMNFQTPWKQLSLSEIQFWEHQILQDPKNRQVIQKCYQIPYR